MRQWYRIEAKADDSIAELFIYGDIGRSYWDDDAVSAKQFMDELNRLPDTAMTARVRVNSGGGNPFEAVAIANGLRTWAQAKTGRAVEMVIDGIAASSASVVIMAGTTIRMADNALVMVHNPYGCVCGNAAEMRKSADAFDKVRDTIIATYRWHSKKTDEELIALLDAETWMDADDAIANGFATEKVEGLAVAARLDRGALARLTIPDRFKAKAEAALAPPAVAPLAASAEAVLKACREGECLDLAEGLIAAKATVDQVSAKVTDAKAAKQLVKARADEITGIVAAAKLPDTIAARLVAAQAPIPAVKALVTEVKALLDKVEIDAGLDPDHGKATTTAWTDAHKVVNKERYGAAARA